MGLNYGFHLIAPDARATAVLDAVAAHLIDADRARLMEAPHRRARRAPCGQQEHALDVQEMT